MGIDYIAVGERIRALRRARKLTQIELAELVGITIAHLSNIEQGKTLFSLQVLLNLSEALQTTPGMILSIIPSKKSKSDQGLIGEIDKSLRECTDAQLTLIEHLVREIKTWLVEQQNNKNDGK